MDLGKILRKKGNGWPLSNVTHQVYSALYVNVKWDLYKHAVKNTNMSKCEIQQADFLASEPMTLPRFNDGTNYRRLTKINTTYREPFCHVYLSCSLPNSFSIKNKYRLNYCMNTLTV